MTALLMLAAFAVGALSVWWRNRATITDLRASVAMWKSEARVGFENGRESALAEVHEARSTAATQAAKTRARRRAEIASTAGAPTDAEGAE